MVIAHRGASADTPENTLSAFHEAIRQKADAIELDVQMTSDKELVIMHDPTLNRTTNGKGLIATKTLSEIKKLDAGIKFDSQFCGECIPTLDEVFKVFGKKTNYVVELKFYHIKTRPFAKQVYDLVAQYGLIDCVLFLSFDFRLLRHIKKLNPKTRVCWAFIPVFGFVPTPQFVQHFDALAIATKKARHKYIDKLHKLNKPVNVWTGLSPREDFRAEIRTGSAYITTNHPAKLRKEIIKQATNNP